MYTSRNPNDYWFHKDGGKPFLHKSAVERREWIREMMMDGSLWYEKNLTADQIIQNGLAYRDPQWDYYKYRVQLEWVDPALAEKHALTINKTRFFMEAYGLERSKPFLPSYNWINAYHGAVGTFDDNAQTKHNIGLLIAHRGAEHVCEEICSRTPEELYRMLSSNQWGESFIEILGLKAVSGLPAELATKIKSRHLEHALGM